MSDVGAPRKLRIAIASLGRFHVLDLARELSALGHEVHFYSYVPKSRAVRFGLPARCHVSLLVLLWPWVALSLLIRRGPFATKIDKGLQWAANVAVRLRLQPCDVFIGMSGIYVEAAEYAKRRYGSSIVVERGSMHIQAQREILAEVRKLQPEAGTVPDWAVERELRSYGLADRVVVPSTHAEASFLARGFSESRLVKIPYGVELDVFSPDPVIVRDARLIIFVGAWSYQKGVDILTEAMQVLSRQGMRLCHIGSPGDAKKPDAAWFSTVGHVDQLKLREWYCRAALLVLPSRQDGFGLVLTQALACGCPIVGSRVTGAVDLAAIERLAPMVSVVDCSAAADLCDAIVQCMSQPAHHDMVASTRQLLSWTSYGRRYASMLATMDQEARDSSVQ